MTEPRLQPLYQILAGKLDAHRRCSQPPVNTLWEEKHREAIDRIMGDFAPHGSGFDSGTAIDYNRSTTKRLVFHTSFHHMNENGMYDGWTDHDVIIDADLYHGFLMRITGTDRNDIKDYIQQVFDSFLTTQITWDGNLPQEAKE